MPTTKLQRIEAYVTPELKKQLLQRCKQSGLTQSAFIAELIAQSSSTAKQQAKRKRQREQLQKHIASLSHVVDHL